MTARRSSRTRVSDTINVGGFRVRVSVPAKLRGDVYGSVGHRSPVGFLSVSRLLGTLGRKRQR